MNKQNRKELDRAIVLIEQAQSIIQNIRDEEDEKFNNLTEALQQTERGQKMEQNVDTLDSALSSCEEVIEYIQEASE